MATTLAATVDAIDRHVARSRGVFSELSAAPFFTPSSGGGGDFPTDPGVPPPIPLAAATISSLAQTVAAAMHRIARLEQCCSQLEARLAGTSSGGSAPLRSRWFEQQTHPGDPAERDPFEFRDVLQVALKPIHDTLGRHDVALKAVVDHMDDAARDHARRHSGHRTPPPSSNVKAVQPSSPGDDDAEERRVIAHLNALKEQLLSNPGGETLPSAQPSGSSSSPEGPRSSGSGTAAGPTSAPTVTTSDGPTTTLSTDVRLTATTATTNTSDPSAAQPQPRAKPPHANHGGGHVTSPPWPGGRTAAPTVFSDASAASHPQYRSRLGPLSSDPGTSSTLNTSEALHVLWQGGHVHPTRSGGGSLSGFHLSDWAGHLVSSFGMGDTSYSAEGPALFSGGGGGRVQLSSSTSSSAFGGAAGGGGGGYRRPPAYDYNNAGGAGGSGGRYHPSGNVLRHVRNILHGDEPSLFAFS